MSTTLPAPAPLSQALTSFDAMSILNDDSKYGRLMELAKVYANSSLVPDHFRKKPEDCFIVWQMALRLGADPFQLMQATYVVAGKPGMEAKMIIALVNRSGQFRGRLRFRLEGEGNTRQATAWAIDRDGEPCEATYKFQTAIDEGLVGKNGSKWKTMPDIMLQYRAATVFARLFCPDVIMGMPVIDDDREIIDAVAVEIEPTPLPMPGAPEPEYAQRTEERNTATASTDTEDSTILEMRAAYKTWNDSKKEAYQKKHHELMGEGLEDRDAVISAYNHVQKYFQ